MVERKRPQYHPFKPGEMEQARKGEISLPPLSPRQQKVFDLATQYQISHEGGLISQTLIAQELGVSRAAVGHHVRKIMEKGYKPPIVTKYLIPWLSRRNELRLRALQDRAKLIEQVKELKLGGATIGRIRQVTGEDKNVILGILDYLRRKEGITRGRIKKPSK